MQVKLENIGLTYDNQQPLFDDLNCTVLDGELVALLGPSGSGKTTLLNLIAGLLTPTAGTIRFGETEMTHRDVARRRIGMVFQDYALYPHLSVLDNIAFPLKMARVKKAQRYAQAREVAAFVHVTEQLDQLPGELSGGQQQRVAIARALIKQPDVLLLDEPLSNLDAALRIELRDEIRRIQQATHTTTVFVTHDQSDALQIADRIILMRHGQIQQVGTGMTLYRHPQNQFVAQFIGTPQMTVLPVEAVLSQLAPHVASGLLARATTIGIRSEAVQLATTDDQMALTGTITRQVTVGREVETTVKTAAGQVVSTAITTHVPVGQSVQLAVTLTGCYLFDRTGTCIWEGTADD